MEDGLKKESSDICNSIHPPPETDLASTMPKTQDGRPSGRVARPVRARRPSVAAQRERANEVKHGREREREREEREGKRGREREEPNIAQACARRSVPHSRLWACEDRAGPSRPRIARERTRRPFNSIFPMP